MKLRYNVQEIQCQLPVAWSRAWGFFACTCTVKLSPNGFSVAFLLWFNNISLINNKSTHGNSLVSNYKERPLKNLIHFWIFQLLPRGSHKRLNVWESMLLSSIEVIACIECKKWTQTNFFRFLYLWLYYIYVIN